MRHFFVSLFTPVALLFFLFSLPLYAQQQAFQAEVKTVLDYKKELGLTQSQADKIKVYIFDLERELNGLRERLNAVNREIAKLLEEGVEKQGSLKLSEVEKKIKEAFEIRAQLAIAEIRTAEKINASLTPEQFQKWKEVAKEREMRSR